MDNGLPVLSFFWWMLIFFLWVIWIWLLITIFIDIFRDKSHSGWSKALWVLFLLVLPFLGVLVYLIARGDSMQDRQIEHAMAIQERQEEYIRELSGGDASGGTADALAQLAELHKNGVLTDDEFAAQKAKLLS